MTLLHIASSAPAGTEPSSGIAASPAPSRAVPAKRRLAVVGLTLAVGYVVVLIGLLLQGFWLVDQQGRPIASDFVNVWAAGQLTLEGQPVAAYDRTLHKAAETSAVGHEFDNYYGWHYAPPFLFVAALLALMPFTPAALLWLAVTLPGYLACMRAIIADRSGVLVGLGFPAVLWNVTAGQNGFLTASLIGGTLALLQRSPVLSGICLGLLTYKPQFGLLFPVALIAERRWLVIVSAAITALVLALLSWLVFGAPAWIAFLHGLGQTSDAILVQGLAEFARLQSVFGFVRGHGGSETLAWMLQAGATLGSAALIWRLWRSRAAFELKAAALSCGALLATPYLYMYDLVALAIPVAFLLRLALQDVFRPSEIFGLAAVVVLILLFPLLKTQVGLAAVLIVAALIVLRWLRPETGESSRSPLGAAACADIALQQKARHTA